MRLTPFLSSLSLVATLLVGGCSYRFCDIGPVCRAEHIFLPRPLIISTIVSDENLAILPLRTTFSSATINFVDRVLPTELDTADALIHENLGLYVFDTAAKTYTVKLKNIHLSFKPEFPHNQVPSPRRAQFCLKDINYGFTDTALVAINGKPIVPDLLYSDICADFPASDLGAWIDCGDGCPPTASLP